MALSEAHQSLLTQIAEKVHSGQLARQAFGAHGVEASVPQPGLLCLDLKGSPVRAVVNAWIVACAAQFGSAQQRSSSDGHVIIDVSLP